MSNERNSAITIRSNLRVKISPHFFKCGAIKIFAEQLLLQQI